MTKTSGPQPGDRITWRQYSAPGAGWQEPFDRTGTVFAGAPIGNGLANAWWVHPDEYGPNDPPPGVPVAIGRCSRRSWQRESEPQPGEVYGSWDWQHQPCALTTAAVRWHDSRAKPAPPAELAA